MDVFMLPGDKLTATSAIKHYIPTPSIPAYLTELQNSGASSERGRNPNSKDVRG